MQHVIVPLEMAIELLEKYVDKVHMLGKFKNIDTNKAKEYFVARTRMASLLEQLNKQGVDMDTIMNDIYMKLDIKYKYKKVRVYIDGAARGNDDKEINNESAAGFVVFGDLNLLHGEAAYLGSEIVLPQAIQVGEILETAPATNNVSEYIALINALEYLVKKGIRGSHIEIFSDSNVVVQQVNKTNVTRAPHLIKLRDYAIKLLQEFENISLTHIPRENNKLADKLVNTELDKHSK